MFSSTFRKMKPKILRNPVSLVIFLLVILVILVILTNLMILTNLNLVMKLKNLLILAIPIYLWILVIVLNSMNIRAGPQSQKWSDQQITLNPTGSIHKKAREKKFDPKKVYFDEGVFIWKFEKSLYKGQKSKLS